MQANRTRKWGITRQQIFTGAIVYIVIRYNRSLWQLLSLDNTRANFHWGNCLYTHSLHLLTYASKQNKKMGITRQQIFTGAIVYIVIRYNRSLWQLLSLDNTRANFHWGKIFTGAIVYILIRCNVFWQLFLFWL